METKTTPKDWPLRIRLAVQKAATPGDRQKLVADLETMLQRLDPMGLRSRGVDAGRRRSFYANQVAAQLRAA